ncbi:MAG: GTP cyclohydrolase II [Myxococcales bacterium]|jgi:GTP cyclohydrolase II|nr:GTP cyclohydrolase II [Myxococcales bacterium]
MHVPSRVIRPQAVWLASAEIPTKFGTFETHVFRSPGEDGEPKEHVALVHGDIVDAHRVPVRVHSECMTSEVFGSLKCDCKEQLEAAQAEIVRRGSGAILYLRQEGRGIGLPNKIRAYALQADGHDTVDANRLLGLPDDAREYHAAHDMLAHFGVRSIVLLTNNPAKVSALEALGVTIEAREPVHIRPNQHSAGYLEAKRLRMAHELPAWARRAANGGDAE